MPKAAEPEGGKPCTTRPARLSRGVRMASGLWEFVDDVAELTDSTPNAVLEKWVSEKRAAVLEVA